MSNNHHEGHEDNEVKKLQALQVLHGKKKPKPLQVRKRDYFRLSCALQGFQKRGRQVDKHLDIILYANDITLQPFIVF